MTLYKYSFITFLDVSLIGIVHLVVYRGAESYLYSLRQKDKVKTKVKIGTDDLLLATKVPGSSFWRTCPLPDDLPSIDHPTVSTSELSAFFLENIRK